MTTWLWVIVPYVCLAIFVAGHIWRYQDDKFGRAYIVYRSRDARPGVSAGSRAPKRGWENVS